MGKMHSHSVCGLKYIFTQFDFSDPQTYNLSIIMFAILSSQTVTALVWATSDGEARRFHAHGKPVVPAARSALCEGTKRLWANPRADGLMQSCCPQTQQTGVTELEPCQLHRLMSGTDRTTTQTACTKSSGSHPGWLLRIPGYW